MIPIIKICGLKTPEAIEAAQEADYLGFIFFPASPRYITPENAGKLKPHTSQEIVAVTVDPDDMLLSNICAKLAPDYIQLHGSESPMRVKEIKQKFHIPVIKAFQIMEPGDFAQTKDFETVADLLLFDAKSSHGMHGGSGIAFDWHMLAGRKFKRPYFLSGGLNIGNIEDALSISGANMIDISSGVESSRGEKSPAMIAEFITKARSGII